MLFSYTHDLYLHTCHSYENLNDFHMNLNDISNILYLIAVLVTTNFYS